MAYKLLYGIMNIPLYNKGYIVGLILGSKYSLLGKNNNE